MLFEGVDSFTDSTFKFFSGTSTTSTDFETRFLPLADVDVTNEALLVDGVGSVAFSNLGMMGVVA